MRRRLGVGEHVGARHHRRCRRRRHDTDGAGCDDGGHGTGERRKRAPTTDTPAPPAAATASDTSDTSDTSTLTSGTPATTVFSAADFAGLGTCLVYPQLTAGPFPSVELMERRDITEGMAGHPLRVGIQLVDESCAPIPGALVEIWHCDVDGDYSAYSDGATDDDAGEGTTFYRGYQTSNTDGIVEFLTSYPGWYRGRAVHIHSTVHIDEATVLDDAVPVRGRVERRDHGARRLRGIRVARHDERRGRCHARRSRRQHVDHDGERRCRDRRHAGPHRRRCRPELEALTARPSLR